MADIPVPPVAVRSYRWMVGLMILVEIAVFLLVGVLSRGGAPLVVLWGAVAASMLLLVMVLGAASLGTPWGVLISNRNVMSLSRLQVTGWTLLVCSAFVTVGIARVFTNNVTDPLSIRLPTQLWQLLGISATSTIGASLILQNKTNKDPANPAGAAERVATQTKEAPEDINKNRQGIAYANPKPSDARLTDIFEGDELGNTAYIDISKVQMFLFTLIALIAYAANLYDLMTTTTAGNLGAFPALSPGLVGILGISHVAYLGNKSVDHTRTT